jgi:hypothetical protein
VAAAARLTQGEIDMKLIPHWRAMWRAWSVRLNAVGLVIMGWVFFDPSAALFLLNSMPLAVQRLLPGNIITLLSVLFYAAAILARIVKQPKLEAKTDAAAK